MLRKISASILNTPLHIGRARSSEEALNVPARHGKHSDAPEEALYLPATHWVHSVGHVTLSLYVPDGQFVKFGAI